MNKNRNSLILMSIVLFTCGQLLGLTRKQFAQLNRLKKQIEARFTAGPGADPKAWAAGNQAIIDQMNQLDRRTAVIYQQQQDAFTRDIKERAATAAELAAAEQATAEERRRAARLMGQASQAQYELEQATRELAELEGMQDELKGLMGARDELAQAQADLTAAQDAVAAGKATEQDLRERMTALNKEMQDAQNARTNVIDNIIIKVIDLNRSISNSIQIITANSTPAQIEPVIDEIKPFLFRVQALLTAVPWNDASENAQDTLRANVTGLTTEIAKTLASFVKYIMDRNNNSQVLKENFSLTREDFEQTANSIQAMHIVLVNLYEKLPQIFENVLSEEIKRALTNKINMQNQMLSRLKTTLYEIYKVTKDPGTLLKRPVQGHIQIQRPVKEDDKIESRTSVFKDPLEGIRPSLDEIVSEEEIKGAAAKAPAAVQEPAQPIDFIAGIEE